MRLDRYFKMSCIPTEGVGFDLRHPEGSARKLEKMRNLEELNFNIGGKSTDGLEPHSGVIAEFERTYNVRLPRVYLDLLEYANGGYPELDTIFLSEDQRNASWAVNHFYCLDEDRVADEGLWQAMKIWRPILGEEALPFASDGGGNQFYIDLSQETLRVCICIHDEGFRKIEIAKSFEEFIDRLKVDPDQYIK